MMSDPQAEIRGFRPSIYMKYNGSIPYEERVDTVVEWLADPDGPRMINLYAAESPDKEGSSDRLSFDSQPFAFSDCSLRHYRTVYLRGSTAAATNHNRVEICCADGRISFARRCGGHASLVQVTGSVRTRRR